MRMSDCVWVLKHPTSDNYVVTLNDRHSVIWSDHASDAFQFPTKASAFAVRNDTMAYCRVMRRRPDLDGDGPFELSGNRIIERQFDDNFDDS